MTPSVTLSLSRPRTPDLDAARRGLALGVTTISLALPALILIQYALPPRTDAHYWGLDPEGMHQFQAHFGLRHLPTLGVDSFSLAFRLLLVTLWSGYALAVLSAMQGAKLSARPILAGIVGAAVGMAVFCPPLLSHDVYAYAGHGRIFALYGQNPYLTRPAFLAAMGDPVTHFITWNWPTVYGPVWTRIEIAVVGLLHGEGLWSQVVALKLTQAGALVGMALAGRRIAAHLCPGRENLTLLAIGLNPMLLLEGPGSGHNDLLLVCLLLVGAMFYLDKKYLPAALCLGLSVGIKLITLAVLPWALMEYGKGRPGRQKLAAVGIAVALVLLPLIICYGHLWSGGSALTAMQARSLYHLSADALAQNAQMETWLRAQGLGAGLASLCVTLVRDRLVIFLYGALTLWLLWHRQPGAWLTAWAIFSAALMFLAMGLPFPWYIAWFWPVCLLRWDRFHLTLSAVCFGLSLAWISGYGIVCQT